MPCNAWTSGLGRQSVWVWAVLAMPLVAIKLLVWLGIGYYTAAQFACDAAMAFGLCGAALLIASFRWAGAWLLAMLLYATTLLVEVAEAISYYFQASSFNDRFFANVRLANLRSGLDAFGGLLVGTALLLAVLPGGGLAAGAPSAGVGDCSHRSHVVRMRCGSGAARDGHCGGFCVAQA